VSIAQGELTTEVQQSVSYVGAWFAANQSRLITAAVLLALGVVLAFALRLLVVRVITAIERAVPGRAFVTSFLGIARERRVADIIGGIAFWAVLLFFVATAADALGLPLLSAFVKSFSLFVPRLFTAVLILIAGLVLGNLARGTVMATAATSGTTLGPGLSQLVRIAIVTAAILIALAELGVDIAILTAIFSVTLAALLGGFALAFGLGARTAVSNIIGSHYLRKTFEIGQVIRIGEAEGTIAELTATSVILDVPDGRMVIPAQQFAETATLLRVVREPT